MISKGSVTISLLSRRRMIAAACGRGHASACAPTVVPAGGAVRHARRSRPTVMSQPTARRYRSPCGLRQTARPQAVILGLHGFGDYRKAWEEPAEIWAKAGITTYSYDQRGFRRQPDARPLARHRGPGRRRQGDGRAAARQISRRAALSRRREHGRRGRPGRRRPRRRGRRADPARPRRCARATRSGRSPARGLWFFAHTIPVVAVRPDLDRLPADRQSQDHGEAAERSA